MTNAAREQLLRLLRGTTGADDLIAFRTEQSRRCLAYPTGCRNNQGDGRAGLIARFIAAVLF